MSQVDDGLVADPGHIAIGKRPNPERERERQREKGVQGLVHSGLTNDVDCFGVWAQTCEFD